MDDSVWEIISPKYNLGDLDDSEQWWYFEGHFWGAYEEQLRHAAEDCKRLMRIQELLETNRALEARIKKIQDDFTWADGYA